MSVCKYHLPKRRKEERPPSWEEGQGLSAVLEMSSSRDGVEGREEKGKAGKKM